MLADGEVMDDSGGDVGDVSDVGTDGTVFDQLDTEGLTPTGGPVEQPGDRDLSAIGAPAPVGQAPSTPGAYVPTQPTQQDIASAIGDTVHAGANTAEAQRAVPGAKSEQEDALARAEEDKATQVGLDRLELDDQREQHDAALKSATDDLNEHEQAVKDFKFHDHWAEKPLANQVLAVLFSAIGGGAAAVAKTPNYALAQIERAEQLDYNKQLQGLRNAEKFVEWKRAGVKDMGAQFEKERAGLIQGQSYKLQQMADYAKAQYIRTGHTVEEANNNVIVQGLYQKAAEKKEEALSKLYSLETARIKSEQLMKARQHVSGGKSGGPSPALTELIKMKESGALLSEISARAAQLGVPSKAYLPMIKDVEATTGRTDAAAAKKQAAVDSSTVTFADGTAGRAPSPRVVKMIQDRDVNYESALNALKALKGSGKLLPQGALYDNAVLGVATVTTANASDKTTAHESGTLKDWGLLSKDAIQRKIDEIETRRKQFHQQYSGAGEASSTPTAKSTSGVPDGATGTAKDGTPVVRKNGKWIAANG